MMCKVDLIIDLFQKPLPIDVKYRGNVTLSDLKGLRKFNDKFKSKVSIAVTKNQLGVHDDIVFIPLWMYLLMG
ncbi:MAG: hypothetical protein OEL81_01925 [Nitrosopumilus sp.]|nr:hypothetical protein [Nitrosopumilus sp.]